MASKVMQTEVLTCSGNERINCHPSQYLLEDAVPTFPHAGLQSFLLGRGSCEPRAASLQLWYLVLFPGEAVPQGCWYLCSGVRQVGRQPNPGQSFPQPLNWQLGWGHACLQLGDTLAFLSPLLVNCMGSHFINHLQGEPAGSFLSVPSSLLWP